MASIVLFCLSCIAIIPPVLGLNVAPIAGSAGAARRTSENLRLSSIPGTSAAPSDSRSAIAKEERASGTLAGAWAPPSRNAAQRRGNIFSIEDAKDLLEFAVEDERLGVVKVYASWCVTCNRFDSRYRKLANRHGDSYDGTGTRIAKRGAVRFAEMRYDNPGNAEICQVLNVSNFPYILMYKGAEGKVEGFHCTPAEFQRLVDAVNRHLREEGAAGQDQRYLPTHPIDGGFRYGKYNGELWDLDAKKDVYNEWDPSRPRSARNFNPFETFRGNSCDASGLYPGEPRYREPVQGNGSYVAMLDEMDDAVERAANPKPGSERGCPGCKD